ncbi:MAG: ribonuclease Z [Desulfurococcales archaeon]|nr:ribonuclease Z [Desulfurococcales archaeon]
MVEAILLGTGAALHPGRGHSSLLILGPGEALLVDAGCTVPHSLARAGVNPARVARVIVTHGHADHYCGLTHIAFMKTFTGTPELSVYTTSHAVPLVERLLASIHRPGAVRARVEVLEPGRTYIIGPYRVSTFRAIHSVEALSLEISVDGRRILVSGDTEPTVEYRRLAEGADLAVHEASLPESSPGSGHSSVGEALSQVARARVGLLYHLTPESEEAARQAGISLPEDLYRIQL